MQKFSARILVNVSMGIGLVSKCCSLKLLVSRKRGRPPGDDHFYRLLLELVLICMFLSNKLPA